MSEDANKVKRLNTDAGEQPQTFPIVAVPVDVWAEVLDKLEMLPRKETKLLWSAIQNLQPQNAQLKGDIS